MPTQTTQIRVHADLCPTRSDRAYLLSYKIWAVTLAQAGCPYCNMSEVEIKETPDQTYQRLARLIGKKDL